MLDGESGESVGLSSLEVLCSNATATVETSFCATWCIPMRQSKQTALDWIVGVSLR
jgi:hypothetical protein